MARKTFKDDINNPALAFISDESIREADSDVAADEEMATEVATPDSDAEATVLVKDGRRIPKRTGYRINPEYIETKSARLQLLVQPSLRDKLKKRARMEGKSVNDLVHGILEQALMEDI